jgi:toxin-antitoxin system PIN domain toxin
MRALLDVNVLIALLDGAHQHHRLAWQWLDGHIEHGWASCPLTQNAYVRIVAQPGYPNPSTVRQAVERLGAATRTTHHEFWPDQLSLLDDAHFDADRLLGPRYLTDHYLLALAAARGGRLVSFDRGIGLGAVRAARPEHLVLI